MHCLPSHRVVGLKHVGSIETGKRADLCFLDQELNLQQTMVAGHMEYSPKPRHLRELSNHIHVCIYSHFVTPTIFLLLGFLFENDVKYTPDFTKKAMLC